jgi:hypothetical protein
VLSSREREALEAIEAGVRSEDPAFADRLAGVRPRRRTGRRVALAVLVAGVVGLVGGLVALSPPAVLVSLVLTAAGGTSWLWLSGAVSRG